MNHRSLFTEFYCLPLRDIVVLFAVATWAFLRMKERFQTHWLWKCFLVLMLLGFSAAILHLTTAGREAGSRDALFLIPFHSYREVLNGGNPEILRSNFMNVVLFYPSGLLMASLLPAKWPRWIRVALTLLLFAGLSAGVEYAQYLYHMGQVEIDDVIHNSLGALIGSLCSLIPIPPKNT